MKHANGCYSGRHGAPVALSNITAMKKVLGVFLCCCALWPVACRWLEETHTHDGDESGDDNDDGSSDK